MLLSLLRSSLFKRLSFKLRRLSILFRFPQKHSGTFLGRLAFDNACITVLKDLSINLIINSHFLRLPSRLSGVWKTSRGPGLGNVQAGNISDLPAHRPVATEPTKCALNVWQRRLEPCIDRGVESTEYRWSADDALLSRNSPFPVFFLLSFEKSNRRNRY